MSWPGITETVDRGKRNLCVCLSVCLSHTHRRMVHLRIYIFFIYLLNSKRASGGEKNKTKKNETRMTATVLKQDPKTQKVQKNAVY